MAGSIRFPIRLKITVALLCALAAVVITITFTMARFFHQDKQSYINDWVSIAAMTTAEECRSTLEGYRQRLEMISLVMANEDLYADEKKAILENAFENFPELLDVVVSRDGQTIEAVRDEATLQAAGLSGKVLDAFRKDRAIAAGDLAGGVSVVNSTLSEDLPTLLMTTAKGPNSAKEGANGGANGANGAEGAEPAESPTVVSAFIRLDELMNVGARFRVFEVMLVAADGTLLAHPDPRLVSRHTVASLGTEQGSPTGRYQAGVTTEYDVNGVPLIGGFADAGFAGITAVAQMPRSAAYLASRNLLNRLVWIAAGLLIVAAVAGRLWARRIVRPMERLSDATKTIAQGRFDIQVGVKSRDEIGALADSFNTMATGLDTREKKLQAAQAQLVQSEKLAAFGQLSAGIAHEVKNPLAGILGCAQLSLLEVPDDSDLHTNLKLIEKETERCKEIIDNLMKFARQEKAIMEPVDVNKVVADAITIVNHHMGTKKVRLFSETADGLPQIRGNANQLEQVIMNLMINAQQAMEGKPGNITLSTKRDGENRVAIDVRDDGPGMTEEIRRKLFEPFFTTKPTGKGTGLGLSVSYGIVQDHGGEITVESTPGEGATFTITLPVPEPGSLDAPAPATSAQADPTPAPEPAGVA